MEPPNEFASLVPLYEQLRDELKLDTASFQVPPAPCSAAPAHGSSLGWPEISGDIFQWRHGR